MKMKKFAAFVLAAVVALTSVTASAVESPTQGGQHVTTPAATTEVGGVKGSTVSTNAEKKTATVKNVAATKKTSLTVKKTVEVNGATYEVTRIAKNAFAKCKKLKKVVIGTNVTTYDAKAFSGAKKLTTITITGKKKVKMSKDAFKGLKTSKMTIKVTKRMSKSNYNALKKSLKKAGFKGKIKRY